MRDFSYLIDKFLNAEVKLEPFKHIEINDFFSEEDFNEIISSKEVNISSNESISDLFDNLDNNGYKEIVFPGCTVDRSEYVRMQENKTNFISLDPVEGQGMVFRLYEKSSDIMKQLDSFFASEDFLLAICKKFGLSFSDVIYDGGIQKYLNGYEISPHPDIRRKALTYMININPSIGSASKNIHTRYLELREDKKYIESVWENEKIDRCWVPWDWANVVKTQTLNNSIVIFSPNNNTWHAVKTDYNHYEMQRTQFYGNLWYKDRHADVIKSHWRQYDVARNILAQGDIKESFIQRLRKRVSSKGQRNIG